MNKANIINQEDYIMQKAIAFASMWFATSFAVAVGLYFTKDPSCLWALVIPTFFSFKFND